MEIANGVTVAGESDDPHLAVYVLLLLPVIIYEMNKEVFADLKIGKSKEDEPKEDEPKEDESNQENAVEAVEPKCYNDYENSLTLPVDVPKPKVHDSSSGNKMSDEFKPAHF